MPKIMEIVRVPDPILRKKSKPLEAVDNETRKLLDDMAETMYQANGIGLAAVQVGELVRAITIDCAEREEEEEEGWGEGQEGEIKPTSRIRNPMFLVNPKIVSVGDEPNVYREGCLSIPEFFAEVERPKTCVVEFLDREGKQQTLEADGLLATCIQHEVDHLNGKLFVDYLSKLKRDMVIKKFTKIQNKKESDQAV